MNIAMRDASARAATVRTRLARSALAPLLAVGAAAADGGGNPCLPGHAVADQVVVELSGSASIDEVVAAMQVSFPGVRVLTGLPQEKLWLLSAPEPICEQALVDALALLPGVEDAELNETKESAEGQSQSFFFAALPGDFADQYAPPLVGADEAAAIVDGTGVVVAVVDTGVDAMHPLLAGATVLPAQAFVLDGITTDAGDGIDNDGDGATDEMVGHGTFVAGLIHRVAPGAAILPLRAVDSDGHATTFSVAQALAAAIAAEVDVINLSFTAAENATAIDNQLAKAKQKGIVVVVSAGNGAHVGEGPYPAKLQSVIAVAGTDAADQLAPWSNAGPFVDLCAPAVDLVACVPGDAFAFGNGTSFSAALVSGAAALVRAQEPALTPSEVKARLQSTAQAIDGANPGMGGMLGAGRLDAAAAVGAAAALPDRDSDGDVDGADLGALLSLWGTPEGDLDGDGTTDGADLALLLSAWTG